MQRRFRPTPSPFLLLLALLAVTMPGCLVNPVPTPGTSTSATFDNAEDAAGGTGGTSKDVSSIEQTDMQAGTDVAIWDTFDWPDAAKADVPVNPADAVTSDAADDVTATVADDATQTGDVL